MGDVVSDLLDDLGAAPENLSPYDVGVCLGSSHGGATARFLKFLKAKRGEEKNFVDSGGSGTRLSSAAFLNELDLSQLARTSISTPAEHMHG